MRQIMTIGIVMGCMMMASCKKNYEVIMPDVSQWPLFNDPAAAPLPAFSKTAMDCRRVLVFLAICQPLSGVIPLKPAILFFMSPVFLVKTLPISSVRANS
jgi:hypothetical protein